MYLPNGKKVVLYPVSVLSEALGRSNQTIRKWEIAGILPRTMFEDSRKCRLYTKEQIDIIVQCAEECNIKQGKKMSLTDFSSECHRRFDELHEKYFGGK